MMSTSKTKKIYLVILLIGLSLTARCFADDGPSEALWHSVDANGQTRVHLYFFWTPHCPHCQKARPFVETLGAKYSWLVTHSYDLTQSPENVQRYRALAIHLDEPATSVPAFFFCRRMQTGFGAIETTGVQLAEDLLTCYRAIRDKRAAPKQQDTAFLDLPFFGKLRYDQHSLPVLTLMIAGLDAFNPCAFFVLLFLLSLLIHSRSRTQMAVIGGIFVVFSGLVYFLFMAAWLNIFLVIGQIALVTAIAGLIALIIGLINIKDYFLFHKSVSLSIPEHAKPRLFQRMRTLALGGRWPAMIAGTVVLAAAANSYELLCTAGFPMVYTRILTFSALSDASYYLYLALYNVIYIIPLLVIVLLFTVTLGSRKLTEKEGRILKLMSGLMMLGLGGVLLLAPDLLNNVVTAVSILMGAVLATFVISRTWSRLRTCSRS